LRGKEEEGGGGRRQKEDLREGRWEKRRKFGKRRENGKKEEGRLGKRRERRENEKKEVGGNRGGKAKGKLIAINRMIKENILVWNKENPPIEIISLH